MGGWGGRSESREKISSARHTPSDTWLLPPCLEAVTIGVGGHEAGNFSAAAPRIDTQSHRVCRQHINLKRP